MAFGREHLGLPGEHINVQVNLTAFETRLDRVDRQQHILNDNIGNIMGMLDRITVSVDALVPAANSAASLLGELSALIRATAGDPTAVNALADTVDNATSALTAAVASNTPAQP